MSFSSKRSAASSSKGKQRATMSDAAIIQNLAEYAVKHGSLFTEGDRVVPLTITGLKYAVSKLEDLKNSDKKSRTRILRRETQEGKDRRSYTCLFDCFRVCPRLKLQAGAVPDDTVDLYPFNSLKTIEFTCTVKDVVNAPLGIQEVIVNKGTVDISQLGEEIEVLVVRRAKDFDISSIAKLSKTLKSLTIKASLLPHTDYDLNDVFGGDKWEELTHVSITENEVILQPCLKQLVALKKLTLAHNGIQKVLHLQDCTHLTTLDLSDNHVESVEDIAYVLPASVTNLNLSGNRLMSVKGLWDLPKIHTLHVDANHLQTWNEVFYLLDNTEIVEICLKNNGLLMKDVPQYRPLVAGMIHTDRWKDFILDGRPLQGDDISKSAVKNICTKHKDYFMPPSSVRYASLVIDESPRSSRIKRVDLSPEMEAAIEAAVEPAVAAAVALLVMAASTEADSKHLSSGTSEPVSKPRKGTRKYKTVKRVVKKSKQDDSPKKERDSAPEDESSPKMSEKEDESTEEETPIKKRETVTVGSLEVVRGGFLESVVAKSLSDSTLEEAPPAHIEETELQLNDPELIGATCASWRTFVSEVSDMLSVLMKEGTIVPSVARIGAGRNKWGTVRIPTGTNSQAPYRATLLPPVRSEATRLVAVDAYTTDQMVYIRIRSGAARHRSSIGNSFSSQYQVLDDEWDSQEGFFGGTGSGSCALAQPDISGFVTKSINMFEGYGRKEPTHTVKLTNVRTWEIGEAKPWDPKKITVDPSPGSMYVTTNAGVTYLQRIQQAEIRANFHQVSEAVLLAGFEVANEECEECLITMLKTRVNECKRAPQWPIVTSIKGSSKSGRQSFSFGHPPFTSELSNTECVTQEELRVGSVMHIATNADVFMTFGKSLAGKRKPDLDSLEKYDIKPGTHVIDTQKGDVATGEQLQASCYCNVLLGNVSSEQEEKSCWIALSATHTYFTLDRNYEGKGGRATRPFLFLSCHQNCDLQKIEIGFGMQYMRLVYGGEAGFSYLMLPRCRKTALSLLKTLTGIKGASGEGKITLHPSPFVTRPLANGMGPVLGYFLLFMRQDQIYNQKKSGKETYMSFPQDLYPLREMTCSMLPVSMAVTKDDIFLASDRYHSWPDGEDTPNRWHLEKRCALGDIVEILLPPPNARETMHPTRFAIDFEQDDDDSERWHLCTQTEKAMQDITTLIKKEWEIKWRMPLSVGTLTDYEVTKRSKKK
eukprot:TRINITY_DN3140_c0_g1_i1.p1 TRINITY_DN3140_c0_g1~~TRINITY_DN3140_c0_g1_i1.p1  ORF type:complete len:1215 (+),score=352.89 TRINITY_DN3140_c0_g1_i1:46-3690(+)